MNWFPTIFTDLTQAINSAWPERTQWQFVSDFERRNWQLEYSSGKLLAPFALIWLPRWEPAGIRPSNRDYKEGEVNLFYVAADYSDIDATLAERLSEMESYLRETVFQAIRVLPGFGMNWGPDNPFNTARQKIPLTAGQLSFRAQIPGANVGSRG